jgi:hypothetical protein
MLELPEGVGPGIDPVAVAVDPLGKFVYVAIANDIAYSGPRSLAGYQIGAKGVLKPVPGSPFFPPIPIKTSSHFSVVIAPQKTLKSP